MLIAGRFCCEMLTIIKHLALYIFQIALVMWTESVNLALVKRSLSTITLKTPTGALAEYTILQSFPFTSESKRMGIIVKVWSTV